jgi:hypothetical protein
LEGDRKSLSIESNVEGMKLQPGHYYLTQIAVKGSFLDNFDVKSAAEAMLDVVKRGHGRVT